MRESLMIRPFVELEDSFLCTWPPHLEGLPFCFHEYYPGIPVREWEGKFWEKLSPSKIEVAIRVVVSLIQILFYEYSRVERVEMLST